MDMPHPPPQNVINFLYLQYKGNVILTVSKNKTAAQVNDKDMSPFKAVSRREIITLHSHTPYVDYRNWQQSG